MTHAIVLGFCAVIFVLVGALVFYDEKYDDWDY